MEKVLKDHSLKNYHTFGVDVNARYFYEAKNILALKSLFLSPDYKAIPKVIIGGGSNMLFKQDYEGLVIRNTFKGIQQVAETDEYVWVEAYGGEEWHDLVKFCLQHNLAGIENLSLIPGSVGAAPIQNIGAYGVELKDVFQSLIAMNIETGKIREFSKEDCQFNYRSSIFKKELKGQYFIIAVTLRLNKKPVFNTSYGAIQRQLEAQNIEELSIQNISKVICEIRQSKLPDPKVLGNCGSFFKNAIVHNVLFERIQKEHPNMPNYPVDEEYTKIPSGWLIERCGWKGKRIGDAGTYEKHALVLVNHGHATGKELYRFAQQIIGDVYSKFRIRLEPEVSIW